MTLLFLLACKTVTSTAEPVPEAVPADAVPAQAEVAPAESFSPHPMPILTLNPSELRVDEAQGKLVYAPGSGVQSAHYTEYWMDLERALETLEGLPTEPITLRFQITETHERTLSPAPDMPSPDGGIRVTEHHGFLVAPRSGAGPVP